jgi:hypothetical protein
MNSRTIFAFVINLGIDGTRSLLYEIKDDLRGKRSRQMNTLHGRIEGKGKLIQQNAMKTYGGVEV